MGIVVHKYGGSSVATPERIFHVAERVVAAKRDGASPVVVVSAMGKTTDSLLDLAKQISASPDRRELDMLLTAGERIAMALLAMAIRERGFDAVSLTGSQAGIITTTDHNQARIVEVRPARVREAIERGQIVIVGGFQGVSVDKEVTTLGRGGSDTTAIAMAAALSAPCSIFSDVDGVYSADPKVVGGAQRIDVLDPGEVLELSLRGAKVLAPEAVDYARRHGITIHALSTFQQGGGTVIAAVPSPGRGRAKAVTLDRGVLIVGWTGPRGGARDVLARVEALGLRCKDAAIGGGTTETLRAHLDTLNTRDPEGQLARAGIGGLLLYPELGTVTVVGEGIAERRAILDACLAGLEAAGIAVHAVRTTPFSLCCEVARDRLDDAVRAVFAALPDLHGSGTVAARP
jgi:aspartate kinase